MKERMHADLHALQRRGERLLFSKNDGLQSDVRALLENRINRQRRLRFF